jgi:surface antigen
VKVVLPGQRTLCAAAICCAMLLAGCTSSDMGLGKGKVDDSLVTGSVGGTLPTTGDIVRQSDESTIRDAVSSADVEQAGSQPLAWANADTGSRGSITSLAEREDGNLRCRSFTATRESFDGVGLWEGDTCRSRFGSWQMRSFKPL